MASDYLYHVTTAGAFDSIADDGLHAGSGSSRAEEGEIIGVVEEAGELIEEDDEQWTEFDEMCLFPSELRP